MHFTEMEERDWETELLDNLANEKIKFGLLQIYL